METERDLQEQAYMEKAKIENLEDEIRQSPARRFIPLLSKAGHFRGELHALTPAQYRRYLKKAPKAAVIDKNGRIPWHYALDELASEAGYKSDGELKEAVEKLSAKMQELKSLKSNSKVLRSKIIQAATTPPKAETTRLKSMEPPVFPKNEGTSGSVTQVDGIEITTRRNPSFWQVEKNKVGPGEDSKPDMVLRIRYADQARKLVSAGVQDAKQNAMRSRKMPRLSGGRFKRLPR